MLGIEDKGIIAAYLLSIASSVLCVIWSILMRNKGDEPVHPSDVKWVSEEKKVEQEF